MHDLQIIETLCDMLGRAQEIIREQAELLAMHGVETEGNGLETRREKLLDEIGRNAL
jgi:hypothetical protein